MLRPYGTREDHSPQDSRTSPQNWQEWRDTRNRGLHVVPVALGAPVVCLRVWRAFLAFLLEARSREPVCNQGDGLDCPSLAILAKRIGRFETNVARPMYASTSNAKQKIARPRVDWNEQRLHRSQGQLILAKLAQQQIHTILSEAQNFSFAVARYEGRFQQCT